MRIVAGRFRGAVLHAPQDDRIRPTAERAREAVFNILRGMSPSVNGARVLDLFAGTGALGFEALSRGAEHCLFVERDRAAIEVIERNLLKLKLSAAEARIERGDVLELPRAPEPVDVVFCDPPYGGDLAGRALAMLLRQRWLHKNTLLVVETGTEDALAVPLELRTLQERRYGPARFTFITPGVTLHD